ncbi:MAG: hypothetical protein WB586_03350 [Chthoniobacterales bacterium]
MLFGVMICGFFRMLSGSSASALEYICQTFNALLATARSYKRFALQMRQIRPPFFRNSV